MANVTVKKKIKNLPYLSFKYLLKTKLLMHYCNTYNIPAYFHTISATQLNNYPKIHQLLLQIIQQLSNQIPSN